MDKYMLTDIIREKMKQEPWMPKSGLSDQDYEILARRIASGIRRAYPSKTKQFLFIEDGSVDLGVLDSLYITNPEIKIVVYRQGGRIPTLIDAASLKIDK